MKGLILSLHLIIVLLQNLSYYGTKTRAKLNGSCLKQDRATYSHGQ